MSERNLGQEVLKEIERRKGLPFESKVASLWSALNTLRDLLCDIDDRTVIRALTLLAELPESDQREILAFIEGYFSPPPEN